MKWFAPIVSTTIPKGWLERTHTLPSQSGPTTVFGSKWIVSPGATLSTSPRIGRRQLSCALNHSSKDEHRIPLFWMYSQLDSPPFDANTSGA